MGEIIPLPAQIIAFPVPKNYETPAYKLSHCRITVGMQFTKTLLNFNGD